MEKQGFTLWSDYIQKPSNKCSERYQSYCGSIKMYNGKHYTQSEIENMASFDNEIVADIISTIDNMEKKRGRKQLSIFTAFLQKPEAPTSIANDLFDLIVNALKNCDFENAPLDVILHSGGGSIYEAKRIVAYLRSKFSDIEFFVAHSAFSAATIMALSANKIILPDYAALSPTDVHYKLKNGDWYPENIYISSLKKIKNSFSVFSSVKSDYIDKYSAGELNALLKFALSERTYTPRTIEYYLLKYMFKNNGLNESDVLNKFKSPRYFLSFFTRIKQHIKAIKAAAYFCNHATHISHNHKITPDELRHLNLSIECADKDCESLLWSLYESHSNLFRSSDINIAVVVGGGFNCLYTVRSPNGA